MLASLAMGAIAKNMRGGQAQSGGGGGILGDIRGGVQAAVISPESLAAAVASEGCLVVYWAAMALWVQWAASKRNPTVDWAALAISQECSMQTATVALQMIYSRVSLTGAKRHR